MEYYKWKRMYTLHYLLNFHKDACACSELVKCITLSLCMNAYVGEKRELLCGKIIPAVLVSMFRHPLDENVDLQ